MSLAAAGGRGGANLPCPYGRQTATKGTVNERPRTRRLSEYLGGCSSEYQTLVGGSALRVCFPSADQDSREGRTSAPLPTAHAPARQRPGSAAAGPWPGACRPPRGAVDPRLAGS